MSTDTVTIPRAEYERLIEIAEDVTDAKAVRVHRAAKAAGDVLMIPDAAAARLIEGESPLRVFRELRGLSCVALAKMSGVNRIQIMDIEAGRATGSVHTLKALADALGVTIDDLV